MQFTHIHIKRCTEHTTQHVHTDDFVRNRINQINPNERGTEKEHVDDEVALVQNGSIGLRFVQRIPNYRRQQWEHFTNTPTHTHTYIPMLRHCTILVALDIPLQLRTAETHYTWAHTHTHTMRYVYEIAIHCMQVETHLECIVNCMYSFESFN